MIYRSKPEKLPDVRLLRQIALVRQLELEAGDPRVPHDPTEWGGKGRYIVWRELQADLDALLDEAQHRKLAYFESLLDGHRAFAAEHPELVGTVTDPRAVDTPTPTEERPGREETLPW